LQTLLQAYIDRWEIECNHRDEKSLIGVAQGQVWNPLAVTRLPLPLWRRKSIRPSTLDLLNLLRDQIFARGMQDRPSSSRTHRNRRWDRRRSAPLLLRLWRPASVHALKSNGQSPEPVFSRLPGFHR